MADPIAQPPDGSATFEQALAELVQALVDDGASPEEAAQVAQEAVSQAPPRRDAYMPKVGAGAYGLPYMPPLAPNRLADEDPAGEVVDSFMSATGLPSSLRTPVDIAYRVGEWGPRQVKKADEAIDRAIREPSVGSIANAGTQTGMAALRPAIALPSVAVQYGDALARDLGLFGNEAQAQVPLRRGQQRELEMERQRSEQEGRRERERLETESKLRTQEEDAKRRGVVESEITRKERDEYDRAVRRADDARGAELAKQRVFKDTAVGKAWEETGGVTPFLMGVGSGLIQRGINPSVSHGRVIGYGAAGGAAASNVPLGADAYLVPPVENPDKRGYEAYARELPPGHPRKREFTEYADKLPRANPARSEAERQLYDTGPAIKRNLFGAAEGAVGSEVGYGLWHIPARLFNALGGGGRSGSQQGGQGGPSSGGPRLGSGGPGTPGTPPITPLPAGTAGASAGGSSPRQLPAPATSPSPQSSPEPVVVTKSKGKDGVTRYHDGSTGYFRSNPRNRLDE